MKHMAILTSERSEEEKARRRREGDKGAKYSSGKIPKIDRGGGIRHDHDDGDKGYIVNRDV